jgi:two-component system cell cycle response regulator
MEAQRTFKVTVIGLSELEVRVMKSVEWIATTRMRSYQFSGPQPGQPTDIYVVNGSDAQAMATWASARRDFPAPSVLVTGDGKPMLGHRGLKRPIIASKLLSVLDEVTSQELGFMPELVIGEEGVPESNPVSTKTPKEHTHAVALVVDDSPTVRKQIEIGLRVTGCTVDCVETAEEALRLLATKSYDIVFLDVVLPGADGYQVCKAIKRDKARKHIPVIMLTGKSSPLDHVKGSLAGCDSYLTKPVQNSVFQEVLKKYLGNNQASEGHGSTATV